MELPPSPEERFRDLFKHLDAEGAWLKTLPPDHLTRVRTAAASPPAWRVFLSGSPGDPELDKDDNSPEKQTADKPHADADSAKENVETKDDVPESSANAKQGSEPADNDVEIERASSPHGEPNGEVKVTPACSPRVAKAKAVPAESPGRRTPLSSPRNRRDSPFKHGKNEDDEDDVALLSAIVRRRLAIASIDEQMFHNVHGALPQDDARFEIDQGMLLGDDGGYSSYEQLEREDEACRTSQTGVYVLLGCDEDSGMSPVDHLSPDDRSSPGVQTKERPTRSGSTPKRPRRNTAAFGLSDQMECFIRELRELCEPHRDAAQEESAQKKDVPKNLRRKAVSAASVVEELKEMEHKAHIGKYERVEECISAVSACIGNQDETFAEVLTQIEDRADALREEYRMRKERFRALMRVKALTTGILGSDADLLESTDEDDDDEDMSDRIGDGNNDTWIPTRHALHIPFAESDLQCWPPEDDALLPVHSERPRVPMFETDSSRSGKNVTDVAGDNRGVPQSRDNLVGMIGADNHIVKSLVSLYRVRKLREQVALNWALLSRKRLALRTASRSPSQQSNPGPVKMEDVLPSTKAPTAKLQASPGATPKVVPSESNAEELEIKNDVLNMHDRNTEGAVQDSRERALGRAVVALMFAHAGFKHASSLAIEVITDVLEDFVERIGHSLVSCRENIDRRSAKSGGGGVALRNPSGEEVYEELKLVCSSGFQGSYLDLEGYARYDILRSEQGLRDAELRLRSHLAKIHHELVKTDARQSGKVPSVSDVESQKTVAEQNKEASSPVVAAGNDIRLDENAFTFGYLSSCVSLDVLGAIKVPRKLTLDQTTKPVNAPVPVSLPKDTEKENSKDKIAPVSVTEKAEITKMEVES